MVHRFSISSPFDDCHLSASTDVSGNTIIEGQIWLNIGGSSLYDMPVAVLRFQCTYSVNYRVTTSIRPIVDDMPPTLNSSSTTMLAGSYDLCKSLTCFNECPSHLVVKPGASYAVGDFINVVLKPRTAMQVCSFLLGELFLIPPNSTSLFRFRRPPQARPWIHFTSRAKRLFPYLLFYTSCAMVVQRMS